MSRKTVVSLFCACTVWFSLPASGHADEGGPLSKGRMNIQAQGAFYGEAWGLDGSREYLSGASVSFGYFFLNKLSINGEVELLGAYQGAWNTFVGGFSIVPRWHFLSMGRFSLTFEAGVGVSMASDQIPPAGTNFNFLILAGPGFTVQLTDRCLLMGAFRYLHMSNASLWGDSRNPDIDSIGFQLGLMFPLL